MKRINLPIATLLCSWLLLLGCPPTAPKLPPERRALTTRRAKPATPRKGRAVAKARGKARKRPSGRREPKAPPGVRYVKRNKDGSIKSRLPGNWRRYARGRGGRVKAVYFEKNQKPDPMAKKLCHALHVLPKERRKVCCKDKFLLFHPGKECVRSLTAAILAKALVLKKAAVDKCVSALHKAYEGCDWVGFWQPKLPEACHNIAEGKTSKGKLCRSGLECAKNMYCHGLGSTVPGRCWTALPEGSRCGVGIDPLAVYLRQTEVPGRSPQCQGTCVRGRCVTRYKVGVLCSSDDQCEKGLHCAKNKCAKGDKAKHGQPCTSGCEGHDRCLKHVCTTPKKAGSPCTDDDECSAGCLIKKGQKKGVCGVQCSVLRR